MKPAKKARRVLLASLLVGTAAVSTGCTSGGMSLASVNPFSKGDTLAPGEPKGISATLASSGGAASDKAGSVGESAKKAWSKTTDAIADIFRPVDDGTTEVAANDPLSLSHKPDSIGPDVFVANGQLWESTGDFGKAMESYTKALEAENNNAPALTSIARLHFRQGNHREAAEYFRKAIASDPKDAGLYNDLGLTLNKLGDRAEATQSLEKALELAPTTSRYANNLASVKYESGDSDGAYRVLAASNKPAVANFNMAYLHFKSGKVNEAQKHLAQVMQFEPQASVDPAIQRAVERSKDMLAQISAATGQAVAQAAPQATVASNGNPYMNQGTPVQQTSQSGTPTAGVKPAGSVSPSVTMPGIATPGTQVPPTAKPGLSVPSYGVPSASPAETTPSIAPPSVQAAASRPMPTRPSMGSATKPASETSATDSAPPSIPFSLPTGFGSN